MSVHSYDEVEKLSHHVRNDALCFQVRTACLLSARTLHIYLIAVQCIEAWLRVRAVALDQAWR